MALFKDFKKIHFRHHKKSKHNALIVGEDSENYDYIKVTHTPKRDKTHKNNSFIKNPNKKDKSTSYYENKVRIDVKINFHEKPIKSWVLSNEDYEQLTKFLKSKKNSPFGLCVQICYSTSKVWFFNSLLEHLNYILLLIKSQEKRYEQKLNCV